MKTFEDLMEAGPRNIPIQAGPATEKQKELVKADKGRRQAVKKASKLSDFMQGVRKVAPVSDFTDVEGAGEAVQKAKEFAASTTYNPSSGRALNTPEFKKASRDLGDEEAARKQVATDAADDAEMERQKIIDMPRGPERQKLLGKDMERRMRLAARAGLPGAMDDNTAANQALDQEMRKGEGDKAE